jgi:Na+/phosphate symporter
MKRGELVILWIGGLLSVALLIIVQAPLSHTPGIDINREPIIAGYVFNIITRLLAIWIVCALVWLTLYRRSK